MCNRRGCLSNLILLVEDIYRNTKYHLDLCRNFTQKEPNQQQTVEYGKIAPYPVDIHGIFFCLHPRRCFRNQPRLSMISGLGSRMYSQRSGGQAQQDLGAFNAFSPEITNFERLLSFICPIEFTPVFVVASS